MLASLATPLVNRLLREQPWAAERLRVHAGKSAELTVGSLHLHFAVSSDGSVAPASAAETPAVRLQLPAEALLNASGGVDALMQRARVEGDAGFADTLGELLRYLRPDLAANLSPFVGDILAQRIDQGVQVLASAASQGAQAVARNARGYLVSESAVLPSRNALGALADELASLQADIERLAARINRLA